MYIEIHNYGKMEQDVLYFKLSNALNIDNMEKMSKKFSGVYVIYKDDICVYVGQSINLASRIATHLRGKYDIATSIFCWTTESLYDDEKYEQRGKRQKQYMLDNAEKYMMAKLKPVENLRIDMDFKLPDGENIYLLGKANITFGIPKTGDTLYITDRYCESFDDLYMGVKSARFQEKISDEAYNIIMTLAKDRKIKDFIETDDNDVFHLDIAI